MTHQVYALILFLVHILVQLAWSKKERQQKISDINVLLPLCESTQCNRVYYTVHAEGGCYEWSVDVAGFIELRQLRSKEESEGCYHKVEISPINNRAKNQIVWLIARDKKTNEQFKVKVGFGKVAKLQITKKFSKINVSEVTKIDVNAYDENNNLFSSVKGFRFHWRITDGNVVQLLKLSQEKVKVGEKRLEVEKKYHSDIILLRGVNPGQVVLTAEILEGDYTGITSDERNLYVVEPFDIYPSDPVYILPDNRFQFDLQILTYSGPESVPLLVLPANRKFYSWSVADPNCGSVLGYGDFQSPAEICKTEIIGKDTRVDRFDTAQNMIHVVHPTALDVGITEISKEDSDKIFSRNLSEKEKLAAYKEFELKNEYDNSNTWKLVNDRYYLIKNILMHERYQIRYSLHAIKFFIDASPLGAFIEDLNCFHEKEVCLIKTKSASDEYLTLESSVQPGFGVDKVYSVIKNVRIFSQVKIEKFGRQLFSLPYLGYSETSLDINSNFYNLPRTNDTTSENLRSQELRLIVSGGTGAYLFNSENPDVIQIREEILYGKLQGKTRVKVTDSDIPSNFDYMEIEVREVKDFHYFEERQEVELGREFLVTPMALKSSSEYDPYSINFYTQNVFTNCTNIKLNTSLSLKDKRLKQTTREGSYSNYLNVRSFLEENRDLLIHKLNWLKIDHRDEENINFKYLNYINYGICDSRGFLAENEGLIRLSFFANLIGKKAGITNKVLSTNTAKVYVYSPISLASPKFEDIFTKELLNKAILADPHKTKNFILAVGSGIIVKFAGGINPWAEFPLDYTENVHIYEVAQNRTSSIDHIRDKINLKYQDQKEMYFECVKENEEKELVITIRNNQGRSLPRPGKSVISISIGCYYPKYLSIFFLGTGTSSQMMTHSVKEETVNDIFSVPQKEGIEYYEKKNIMEVARVYAFDANKRIFSNITSITGTWGQHSISTKTLFKVLTENEYQNYLLKYMGKSGGKADSGLQLDRFTSPEYVHSHLLFENEVGKFDLTYATKNKLLHYATINLIDFPTLLPSNMTVYLSPENLAEILIENGSGDFEINLSDESLASFEYSVIDRKIVLTPLKTGIVYLYVKDNKINNNFMAVATIYISPISRIELLGGGLLMINKTMPIEMRVYDNYNNVFPTAQVKKMNLVIGEFNQISKGIEFIFANLMLVEKFIIKGLISDTYSVYVVDLSSNLTSNAVRVEVFDRLEVFPPSLLMVPGSSYTLSIKGGPVNEQHIVKRYEMINNAIASVGDKDPEIKAHIVGKTVLKIVLALNPQYNKFYMTSEHEFSQNKTGEYILAVEEVNVTVDFPDSVVIRGAMNRKIYTKSTVRLFASLRLRDETFTYGVGPFNFDWVLDNTMIAKLRFYKSSREECSLSEEECVDKKKNLIMSYRNINPFNALGVFLTTSNQGVIEIKLTVTINYPDPYKWRRPNVFVRTEKIVIRDEIYVDIPEFYENIPNKSGLYLIPLNVEHELHTNKNNNFVKYSLISQHGVEPYTKENVISLNENGKVTTYHQTGMAHVLINQKDKENPTFIPVILPIFVTDFYSLFAERSYQLIDMEIGQEVTLKIILQHEYGLLFADGKFEGFKLRSVESQPRVAKAELSDNNSKIKIRANSKGETNIILFHPKTVQILDVFQVSVYTSLILPDKIFLNIGGTVNFLKKDEKRKLYLSQDAEWISDDETVVRIDPIEGKAIGLKEGSTNVHLVSKDRRKVKLTTSISVVRIKNISIDRSAIPQYVTNIKSSQYYQNEYPIPVNFFVDESSTIDLSRDSLDNLNEISQNINFKCVSNQPEIFTAEAAESKESADDKKCLIRIRDIPFDVKPPSNLELNVVVENKGDRYHDSFSYKYTFKLPFLSSFRIKNKVSEMTFSKSNRTQLIYLDNLENVNVDLEDESLFKKEIVKDEESYIKLYVPHNVTSNFRDIKLTLNNKLTNQKEQISLNFNYTHEPETDRFFFGLIKRDTLIDFITLLVLVVTIVILYNYMSKSSEDRRRIIPGPNISASRPPQGSGITSAFNMNK